MYQTILVGGGALVTGYLGVYHLGRCWTKYEMNKIIKDDKQSPEIKEKAKKILYEYSLAEEDYLNRAIKRNSCYKKEIVL